MKTKNSTVVLSLLVILFGLLAYPSIRYAFDSVVISETATSSVASALPSTLDSKKPSKPDDLEIKNTAYGTVLEWDKSSDNIGVVGYRIYRGVSSDTLTPIGFSNTDTYEDNTVTTSTKYYYKVSAVDAAGNESSKSDDESIKTGSTLKVSTTAKLATSTAPLTPPGVLPPPSVIAQGSKVRLVTSVGVVTSSGEERIILPQGITGTVISPFASSNGRVANAVRYYWGVVFDDETYLDLYNSQEGCMNYANDPYINCYGTNGLVSGFNEELDQDYNGILIDATYLAVVPPIPVDTTAPTVSITFPTASSTISGTTTITANATDTVGVVGVQFLADGYAIAAEDTVAPYSYAWNTKTIINGIHNIQAVARDVAGNRATSTAVRVSVNNVGLNPALKPWQNFNLTKWRLEVTATTTIPTRYYLLTLPNYPTEQANVAGWFFTDQSDGAMSLKLDATKTNDGTWYRTELREVMGGTNTNDNWSAHTGTSTMKATIKILPTPTYNGNQVTVLQIHPLSGEPLLRLVWYTVPTPNNPTTGKYLKVHYKTDAAGIVNASAFCPTTGLSAGVKFDADVTVTNGRLVVKVGPAGGVMSTCLDYQINPGWPVENYFKAGNYASQSWMGIGQVNFYKLDVTHSESSI